jgi:predicted XRE-type DNA-binding protein
MSNTSIISGHAPKKKIHDGSGNVFADIGLPDADQRLAKADLANEICRLIRQAGLTQRQAAARMGIDQPKVSALMRGKLKDFGADRLMRFITALDRDVLIQIRPPRNRDHPRVLVLAEA